MRRLDSFEQPPLVTCILKGRLGQAVTTEPMEIHAWSPAAALGIIRCNYPHFQDELLAAEERGVAYRIVRVWDNYELDEDDLFKPTGTATITIEPIPMGSGGGFGKVILGAALVVASFYTGGAASSLFLSTGLALGTQGIAEIISPQPPTPGTEEERKQSALFDGAGGAAEDGDPIFLHYGFGWLSGKVLSASTTTDDL